MPEMTAKALGFDGACAAEEDVAVECLNGSDVVDDDLPYGVHDVVRQRIAAGAHEVQGDVAVVDKDISLDPVIAGHVVLNG